MTTNNDDIIMRRSKLPNSSGLFSGLSDEDVEKYHEAFSVNILEKDYEIDRNKISRSGIRTTVDESACLNYQTCYRLWDKTNLQR